ncbi:acyltransferase family protein [Cupriavidus pauculus]|uniref:acyltransferase family protein n=1 Tax=Cupriavidus pauculus TaxID=82633 RepID=UPI0038578072
MPTKPERLTGVDSLRGIAILLVVAVHSSGFIAPESTWLTTFANLGPRGVQLFYVVSSFSLFLSFANRQAAHQFSYRAYFIRRIARIAPTFWLAMALYLLAFGVAPRYWAPNGVTGIDIALTAAFLNGWSPTAINSIVPGGWSVAIETTFYLLLPFCFLWIRSLRAAVFATVLALVVRYVLGNWVFRTQLPGFPEDQRYLPYSYAWELWLPAQLPVFMLGIVLHFLREKTRGTQPGIGVCWLAGAIALIAVSRFVPTEEFISSSFLAGVGFVLLALAVFDRDVSFLDNPVFRKIGEVSFSIYLLHHLVMHFGAGYIIKVLQALGQGTKGNLSYGVAYLLIVTASTLLALVTYRFVEQPSIRLGNKLARWIERDKALPISGRAEPAN